MNSSTRNIYTIAKRELTGYFASPVAYVFIVIFLLLSGFFTFMMGNYFQRDEASLASFLIWHPWLYMFLVPAAGMRLWSEERRSKTIELLFTMPISTTSVIAGKFIAAWVFLGISLALTFPIVVTTMYLGNPDGGVMISGYLGSFLVAGTYLAIASMTSALTRNQVVSFITSVVVCLLLILAGWPPVTRLVLKWGAGSELVDFVAAFSVMTHFDSLQRGVVDIRDIVYFLTVMAFALFTTGVILKSHRAG
ncbi:MAG: ABC transporter permease [Lentisphaeria bacterium]|nr:ABC transporter permease [Lentisphaeria bacterium]